VIPGLQLTPVLEQWTVAEGRPVEKHDLQAIIKKLVGRRRFSHALEVSITPTPKRTLPVRAPRFC
jgi:hypothetical protein